MNSRKPTLIQPITASTRPTKAKGSRLLHSATASVHAVSRYSHSSSDPSCPPHTAAKR